MAKKMIKTFGLEMTWTTYKTKNLQGVQKDFDQFENFLKEYQLSFGDFNMYYNKYTQVALFMCYVVQCVQHWP